MNSRALLFALATTAVAAPPEPKFRAVTLDPSIQTGYGVAVADVDGDKALDVLLADKKQYVWYRNPGGAKAADAAAWLKYVLAENLTERDNVCLAAQDIDGDGKCEIAVGAEWNPGDTEKSGAVFYLIPPRDRTQRWEAVKFPTVEPTTHRMKWIQLDRQEWGLVVSPLHGRGNKNGEGVPVKTICYRKPADVRAEWRADVIDESLHMTHNFAVISSSRPYLLIGGREGIVAAGWNGTNWERKVVVGAGAPVQSESGVGEIRRGEISRLSNFLCTVEPMHGSQLVVYVVNQGSSPTRRVLTDQLADGHALACGDLLGIGSDQVVVGWRGNPRQPRPVGIKLFTPLDDKGERWRENVIDDNQMACEDLVLGDVNGDGKTDIVASGRSTKNVIVYLNETQK